LFETGGVIAALGVALFARQTQSISNNRNVRLANYLSAAIASLGAAFRAIICYNRVATAPQELVRNMNISFWMYPAYVSLTLIALIIVGAVLLMTGYPKWLGWLVLGLVGLELVAYLALREAPPEASHLIFLIIGIALLLMRSRTPQSLTSAT
jgi:uncharacterized membrane protein YuzA (DUF378 family)